MAYVITEPCIDVRDQSCVEVCPVDCIHFEEGKDRLLYVDPVECIDCGACVPACPEDAIFEESDVPEDQQRFTEINALWFQDPEAARAQVGGAPAPVAEDAPAQVAADSEAAEVTAESEVAVEPAVASAAIQVEAPAPASEAGAIGEARSRPLPTSLISLTGLVAAVVVMVLLPGPRWLLVGGIELHAAVLLLIGPALIFLLLLLHSLSRALADRAARRERESVVWRDMPADWRRGEESRLHDLAGAVTQIAEDRFPFPNQQFPHYRTHVNVPQPTMALEFTDAGGEKLFPDIVVVEHPGSYPVMVVQVETRETLTREQAERVWSRLQTAEAPLNIYVPAGLAAHARDFARAAGIEHLRLRTWRRGADGVIVREL